MLGVWIHNLNPVLIQFGDGPIAVRWYGLAYLTGFIAGYLVLKWMAKRDLWVVAPEKVGDFIAYAALFGVFLGGRLGYVLFYMIPENGIGYVLGNPLVIFKVWEGGMSSHGGILGLTIFAFFYARKAKVSWPGIGDGLVIVSTLGVFFGRMANFINGELYGRTADGVAWAMKFPKELFEQAPAGRFDAAMREAAEADERLQPYWVQYSDAVEAGTPAHAESAQLFEATLTVSRQNDSVLQVLGKYVEARHPSQLYQAMLEGLGLCLVLFLLRIRFRKMAHGIITGVFFILYALFRIVAEQFREPDSAWIIEDVLTKGQFYSVFMIAIGTFFLVFALRGKTGSLGDDQAAAE